MYAIAGHWGVSSSQLEAALWSSTVSVHPFLGAECNWEYSTSSGGEYTHIHTAN